MIPALPWTIKGGRVVYPAPFCLAGILNLTPDSFSDGGHYLDPDTALAHGLRLLADGATMLDLGAESTRPGALPLPGDEEKTRLLPVLTALRRAVPDTILSVDTRRGSTALAALEAGADIINDVAACADPQMPDILATFAPGYVLMHSQGDPATMQNNPRYTNVVDEVLAFFERELKKLQRAGLPEDRVALDPGIGFGKRAEHSFALLRHIERFATLGRPVYVGLSMKSFLGDLLHLPVADRGAPTLQATALLAARGVRYHRVHDVAGAACALRLVSALSPEEASAD